MGKAREEDKRSKPENRYLIVVITWVIIFLWANNQRLWALIYTLKERRDIKEDMDSTSLVAFV